MEYLLKASAVIAIFYICYKLFLQRDTFFQSNRWFLLTGLITAFALPFVVIPVYVEYTPIILNNYVFESSATTIAEQPEPTFTLLQLLFTIYSLGVVFFFVRFIVQLFSLARLIFTNKKEKHGQFTYIKTDSEISPFSFFNWIVYNPNLFNNNELEQIITHEKVHTRQYHSIDILLTQLSCIALWFNPFMWFYNKDLKQNLEFIADQNAQNKSGCKKSYQYTLLKTSMPTHQLALTNNFYNSLIKKRIVMLHKSKSKSINQLKYILIIPILTAFLMSFNTKTVYIEKEKPITENSLISNALIDGALITDEAIFNEAEKTKPAKNKVKAVSKNKKESILKASPQKNTAKATGDYEVVVITKDFTDADFDKLKNDLKQKGITAKFKGIKRNDSGEIVAIKIEIKSKNNSKANYSKSSLEPIKPIKISFDKDGESIGISSNNAKHSHGASSTYVIKSHGGKNKIHKSGQGSNVFVFSDDDEDFEIIHEENDSVHVKGYAKDGQHKIILRNAKVITDNESVTINADTIHVNGHAKKGKYAVVRRNSSVNVISADDDDVEVIIESNDNDENSNEEKTEFIVTNINGNKSSIRYSLGKDISYGKNPLIIVDGLEVTEERLKTLKPKSILSVSVLKGDKATVLHGKKAKDGAISIITKDNNKSYKIKGISTNEGKSKIRIRTDSGKQPLYILDGKEIKKSKFKNLDTDNIKEVNVLKGDKAIEKYGNKAKDGVVEIITKKKD